MTKKNYLISGFVGYRCSPVAILLVLLVLLLLGLLLLLLQDLPRARGLSVFVLSTGSSSRRRYRHAQGCVIRNPVLGWLLLPGIFACKLFLQLKKMMWERDKMKFETEIEINPQNQVIYSSCDYQMQNSWVKKDYHDFIFLIE